MIQKLAEKIGEKAVRAILVTVTAMVTLLYHKIDKYFTKKKYFQKGKDSAMELWDEQEKIWKERVEKIKRDTNSTLKEKMERLKELKKAFKEYKKANANSLYPVVRVEHDSSSE